MNERIKYLFQRYADKTCSRDELQELYGLVNQTGDEALYSLMDAHYANLKTGPGAERVDWEFMFQQIVKEQKIIPVRRTLWKRITVAASILLAIGLGTYFVFFNKSTKQDEIVKTVPAKDVKAPETNRAMITLGDGRTVYLDSAANGELVQQGNIKLIKLDNGQIAYQTASGEIIEELQYNSLSNPRGSKVIDMQLSDGSHVWLNAGSSVTFPIAFVGNERRVSVTGEAYFEISHDKTKPFIVSANNKADVTVLGTHFNVNAYDDEGNIKVTLLEGSVSVNNTIIKPGQQAQVSGDVKVVNNVDLAEVMAWKNGNFKFTRTDLKVIMREIGRWYDVEVSYEGNIPVQLYNVGVPRTANVSEVLRGLEFTGAHFSVEGKKIIVRP
jgi:ferric-dicitrate binding protein FerR (iron transport regulator)